VDEKRLLLGIWLDDGYRVKPDAMGNAPCREWTWSNIERFIDGIS
jgi:hypothetical protein